MTRDEAINEVTILLAACNSVAQENPDNAIVNMDRKAQEALQFFLNALYKINEEEIYNIIIRTRNNSTAYTAHAIAQKLK